MYSICVMLECSKPNDSMIRSPFPPLRRMGCGERPPADVPSETIGPKLSFPLSSEKQKRDNILCHNTEFNSVSRVTLEIFLIILSKVFSYPGLGVTLEQIRSDIAAAIRAITLHRCCSTTRRRAKTHPLNMYTPLLRIHPRPLLAGVQNTSD